MRKHRQNRQNTSSKEYSENAGMRLLGAKVGEVDL
jgi:hypothetical protein